MTSISWSKCGNILAIATSQSLSVINTLTWAMIDDLDIPVTVDQGNLLKDIYKKTVRREGIELIKRFFTYVRFSVRGRSQTTLTRFCLFLTSYPPPLTMSIV